jgi:predicted Rossmann fold nucleotide-binding protein DprA/Smf involved in DNA uptake
VNKIEPQLSADTQVILLLCGHFGKKTEREIKPLTSSEYARFAQWLQAQNMRPADLLDTASVLKIKHFMDKTMTAGRLQALLMRGGALALAIEAWTNNGLWIISRSDKAYPHRLKKQLGQAAPPIFYGVGQPTLLQRGGLAIIGSRDINEQITNFTKILAKKAAQQRITVISGGARGVDSEAMLTALQHGGTAIGVLADSLIRAAVASKYREALREERLVLITPFDPNAGFNVGNAMGRNKYVYTLSDWAVVVNSGHQEGGTWAGAQENLKNGWVPLFVRQDQAIPIGNQALLNQGGVALAADRLPEMTDLSQQLAQLSENPLPEITEPQAINYQPPEPQSSTVAETTEVFETPPPAIPEQMVDLFKIIWPYFERQLATEKTEAELVKGFNLHPKQVKIWLARALEMGKIKKLKRPTRYIKVESKEAQMQQSLFNF